MMTAPANAIVALIILIGTLSGGIVGGLALWLFMAFEFASRRSHPPELSTWWLRPLHKLQLSYRSSAPAEKSGRASLPK